MYSKLQYISQGQTCNDHINHITAALDSGCQWIQLRMKHFSAEEIEETALKVKHLCKQYHATFILNDNVAIAKSVDADGVHLGLTDMPVGKAREILSNDKLIGGTANTLQHVVQRLEEKCDYIGLGPFRFTTTKENLSPILGIHGYQHIISQLTANQLETPIYAIGGILPTDVKEIIQAGIYGIALSGILTNAENKKELTTLLNQSLYAPLHHS